MALCLFSLAGAQENITVNQSAYTAPNANESAKGELISFLEEAKAFALNSSREDALNAFGDPNGSFVRKDMYVFAYDFNGTLLAHPYLPELVGRNNLDMIDINGVRMIGNLMEIAKRGGGFAYNVYPNPAEGNQLSLKLLYVLKIDDNLWIGSGIYLPGQVPHFNPDEQRRMKSLVDSARDYALENGKDATVKAFNDPNGTFVQGDLYIFAYDFDGNVICLPLQPKLIGENRINITDPNGVAFVADSIGIARNGSGHHYYIYPNPGDGMQEELKMSYVTKVDDAWYLGAGIYSDYSSSAQNQSLSLLKPSNQDELKTFVQEAVTYALTSKKDKALRDFMDLNGTWVREDVYIFAHDFNGTTLCLPFMPEAVGTNRSDIQNDEGAYINRDMRAIALNGSGFYEYSWRNPVTNQSENKLSFVSKVDDTWYLGSGIYAPK